MLGRWRSSGIGTLALCLLAQGCTTPGAPPGAPPEQTVRVQTPGCARSRCELSNDQGTWLLASTPGSVSVRVSREPLRVSCHSDDGSQAAGSRAASSRAPTSGVGGAVGAAVGGAAVGAALGGAALAFIPPLGVAAVLAGAGIGGVAGNAAEAQGRELRYPALISLPLRCGTDGAAQSADPPPLGLGVRGLSPAEAGTRGLERRTAVLVLAVAAGSRAEAAGLRVGDVLLDLNGQGLGDAADLEERVIASPATVPLALLVWRERQTIDVVLPPATGAPP